METVHTVDTAPDVAIQLRQYELMYTITFADQRQRAEARAGALKGATYPVHGLEAVCSALGCVLDPTDYLVSTYRNLGDAIAKGVPLRALFAEYYGRRDGTSGGKGGPMHITDVAHGFMATSGIVGGGIPLGVGLGLAAQLDREGQVAVVTFGDGATSIGAFHESLNLASLWALPVIFVCQNNQWGEHTPLAAYAAQPDLVQKAAGYAMAGEVVDGFDPAAARAALSAAVERARAGGGPTLLECRTYRLAPHAGVTDMSYVPKEELARAMTREPTPTMRRHLLEGGLATVAELDEVEARLAGRVEDAFAFAAASATMPASEIFSDVFEQDWMVPGR